MFTVPRKRGNNREPRGGKGRRNTGTFEGKMAETWATQPDQRNSTHSTTGARNVAGGLTTLAHHIEIDWLREAYRRTRKDGATGIDRQTADEHA